MGPLQLHDNVITIDAGERGWYNAIIGLDHPDARAFMSGNTVTRIGGRVASQGVTLLQRQGTLEIGDGNRIISRWGWDPSREAVNPVTFTGLDRIIYTGLDRSIYGGD